MRTTVRLDAHLRTVQAKAKPVRLKTVKGGGVRRGVDLDDSASLLDVMES